MKQLLVSAVVALLAFSAGYGAMYLKARNDANTAERVRQSLESQLAEAHERLRAAGLEAELGLLLIDVEQNNFGKAQERSTKLFDGVRAALFACRNETVRKKLKALLEHRDEVTVSLAALKPDTAVMLRKLYVEYAGSEPKTAH